MDRRAFLRALPLAPIALGSIAMGHKVIVSGVKVYDPRPAGEFVVNVDRFGNFSAIKYHLGKIVAGQVRFAKELRAL